MKRTFRPGLTALEDRLVLSAASASVHQLAAKATVAPAVTMPTTVATSLMTHIYQDVLGRSPDAFAASTVVPALQAGTTMAQLATAMVASPEYVGMHITAGASGVANETQYVSALYQTVLGRGVDVVGLNHWVGAIEARTATLGQVAAALVNSSEATVSPTSLLTRNAPLSLATNAMNSIYGDVFGRTPDAFAASTVVPALLGGTTMAQLATAMVASPEYIGMHITAGASSVANEVQYVAALYHTVLGRAADAPGLNFWVSAIETHAATLGQVAAALVNSPEAARSSTSILARNVL